MSAIFVVNVHYTLPSRICESRHTCFALRSSSLLTAYTITHLR